MAVIWLVSYPKSGNTWTRAFLTAYMHAGKVNINRLVARTAGSRRMIDNHLGIDTFVRPIPEIENLRPEAYRRVSARSAKAGHDPILIKVHDVWKTTGRGEPLFPREITRAIVYIVRDPLDVAVSFAHHLGVPPDKAAEHLCNERFTLSIFGPSLKQQVPQQIASWKTHVESWLDRSGQVVYLMKYEDMKADPPKAFSGMLQHLGMPMNPELFAQSVKASSLPALQAQELLAGFQEKSISADTAFFREGKVGVGEKILSPPARAQILSYCGDAMRRLGYLK